MQTSFDTWLAELASAGLGGSALSGDDVPVATRGLAWSMAIALDGNWSTASLAGTVSASPDAASPLVTMTATSGSYSSVTGYTTWTLSLSAGTTSNSTGALPSDTDGDGVEYFPFMIRITPSGGTAKTLVGGALSVVGKV